MKTIIPYVIALFVASTALAADDKNAAALLTSELRAQAPAKWEVHVRWRETDLLLATITPWPYQEAFELWYDPSALFGKMAALCPQADDAVWGLIAPNQDIVLEPTVGGKTGVEARVNCRKVAAQAR